MRHYLKKIENWLLPYRCVLCHDQTQTMRDLCVDCEQALPRLENICLHCAQPLLKIKCANCHQEPLPYDAIYALYRYETPIKQLILELKFKQALINARLLGELLSDYIQKMGYRKQSLPDCVIPIPLHKSRLKERGFNQALEIARPIAKTIKRPLCYQSIYRVKPTLAQATLHALERHYNMQDAFIIDWDFTHQHIAVIDDVITTGETMKAFCSKLKEAGAAKIDVWCCARALIKKNPRPLLQSRI